MKSEPDDFSIDDFSSCPNNTTVWQGIRNYQARNFIRDNIQLNDLVLFYHSSCKVPAIVGIVRISSESQADSSAFDPSSIYFDSKSDLQKPRWMQVDLQFVEKFKQPISLKQLKADVSLKDMVLVAKGARLSVQPVTETEFNYICKLAAD